MGEAWRERGAEDLRVYLDGHWEAREFAELLGHVEFLYDVARFSTYAPLGGQGPQLHLLSIDRYHLPFRYIDWEFEPDIESAYVRREIAQLANSVMSYSDGQSSGLRIAQIHMASPGVGDLAGIGKIVKEVRLFTENIIDRITQREDRAIAREAARQRVLTQKLNNAEKLLRLDEKIKLTSADRHAIVKEIMRSDNFIEGKIIERKITGIESND